jgi:hypothetical protein
MRRLSVLAGSLSAVLVFSSAASAFAGELSLALDDGVSSSQTTIVEAASTNVYIGTAAVGVLSGKLTGISYPGDVPCPAAPTTGGDIFIGGDFSNYPGSSGVLSGEHNFARGQQTLCLWAWESGTENLVASLRRLITARRHSASVKISAPKKIRAGKNAHVTLTFFSELDWGDRVTAHIVRTKRCPATAAQAGKPLFSTIAGFDTDIKKVAFKPRRGMRNVCTYITDVAGTHELYAKAFKRIIVR